MAAKKNTPKSASPKRAAKPAVKSSKPVPAAAKPAKKPVKKVTPQKKAPAAKTIAAPTKKATPAKKAAPAQKVSPAKKALPVNKTVPAKKPAAKPAPRAKVAPPTQVTKATAKTAAVESKVAKVSNKPAPVAKAPVRKSGSSLVNYTAPPAPVKPPFVPPKTAEAPTGPVLTPGSNGSHSPAFVQKQRQRLLDLRDDLVDSMSGMTRDTIRNAPEGSEASGSGQHQGDAGSDAYDRDFALSVLAKEQDALYEIEQALRRIQTGSYGICEMSSRKIPQARLEAIPFARLTVECQAQWEKEYGKRRFRPSNEVGFSGGNYIEDEDSESVSLDDDED